MDTVFLHGIKADLVVGLDAWQRENKAQPVVLNVDLVPTDTLEAAAYEDNVSLTLDYGKLYKSLTNILSSQRYSSIQDLFLSIQDCLPPVKSFTIEINLPKAILLADGGLSIKRQLLTGQDLGPAVYQHIELRKLQCRCIIGVNPHERVEKQRLELTISANSLSTPLATAVVAGISLELSPQPAYSEVVKDIVERVEGSSYQTVEALATAIAQIATMNHGFENATVRIDKPSAIGPIEAAGVQITRNRTFFENKDFWKVKRP